MTFLLDASVLISRCFPEHVHHRSACDWLAANPTFSVCPLTEGALVRFIVRSYPEGPTLAAATLEILSRLQGYEFWPDGISYRAANLERVLGHQQVTDAYLVALAASKGGRLATFDDALAAVHPEAQLVPWR